MPRMLLVIAFILACAGLAGGGAADSREEPKSGKAADVGNCVRVRDIKASRILDDQQIVFDMASGPDLLMRLKRRCPQLAFHDYFSYEARLGQLCAEIDHVVSRAGFMCDIASFSIHDPGRDAKTGTGSDG